jgi:hypothetical protein
MYRADRLCYGKCVRNWTWTTILQPRKIVGCGATEGQELKPPAGRLRVLNLQDFFSRRLVKCFSRIGFSTMDHDEARCAGRA